MNDPSQDPQNDHLRRVVNEVSALLHELGIPAALAGAFAADNFRLQPRQTTDVDFLVQWRDALPSALEDAGFELKIFLDDDAPHLIRARRGNDRVDIIIAGTRYQELAILRAQGGGLTIEDVLVHKLIAWRPKDRDDIASILAAAVHFDQAYVEHWAAEWDVSDRWWEAQTWR